ncbi:UDP-N-acetylmuramate:L-alanyl-gamma-D-glutamyl-meso-diaminopimelate ligase [Pelistega europaea]|uniref:UDP-N-acetylmuramate--L-alanyl-gamma-D-glutamyl-meso-2,6-diaminoheptandioate ligase n=1 Tax=Pelistega europaea TaxID=106147 RepID=A0A7Y4LAG6_9BURK|nr:UDP-N-acetylmuramate:L-alanyl-gamma-D-glutamyl-meso-diaminopimelate ligase [Pelistega europaea]NOL49955.1 UDP-N-acetylmuramate:L-alanyl-gamma-D-glutamyl-meso-diaminopimelate ligase [Pelistega europaea]
MHIHILGICGTFMGGLALIARAAGHKVTGCDAGVYPPMSTQLEEQGIELVQGFGTEQLQLNPDLYIIGNVITRGNPLMEAILEQNLPYTSGPQWLGDHILRQQHVLAVAGTHGKTTTSSMLAWILEFAGYKPNFLIGGIASDFGISARFAPENKYFVIEADEYDTAFFDKRSKFVHYHSRTAILNNLEYDHADIFPDLRAIETQFHHLVRTIPQSGTVITPMHDEALGRVIARGIWSKQDHFGNDSPWQCGQRDAAGEQFEVIHLGKVVGTICWKHTGTHNINNALAAMAAAQAVGIAPSTAIEALCQFQGVRRRMELRGVVNQISVYDDFAHHPTAIATTLDGLRQRVGHARIIAVLEPRSNTMKLGTMAARLPEALAKADIVFCYGEQHGKHALGWQPEEVFGSQADKIKTFHDLEQLKQAIVNCAKPGDHILVMSNGSFGGLHDKLLKAL